MKKTTTTKETGREPVNQQATPQTNQAGQQPKKPIWQVIMEQNDWNLTLN